MKFDKIENGEIVYCNIAIRYKTKAKFGHKTNLKKLERIVFSRHWKDEFPKLSWDKDASIIYQLMKKRDVSKRDTIFDVEVVGLDVIVRTGFKAKMKGFTKVKKNSEQRDKITGAYQ
jgi:hypothetical protein